MMPVCPLMRLRENGFAQLPSWAIAIFAKFGLALSRQLSLTQNGNCAVDHSDFRLNQH